MGPGREETDLYWMRIALGQAVLAGERAEVPIGAVVVLDGRELSRGHNAPISSLDPTGHAEVRALRAASRREGAYRLPGADLYTTLEPCSLCLGAALHARISRIVFGADDPKGGAAGSVVDLSALPGVNHKIELRGGVCADQAASLLQDFFAHRRGKRQP